MGWRLPQEAVIVGKNIAVDGGHRRLGKIRQPLRRRNAVLVRPCHQHRGDLRRPHGVHAVDVVRPV
jgi:hypothetical protein